MTPEQAEPSPGIRGSVVPTFFDPAKETLLPLEGATPRWHAMLWNWAIPALLYTVCFFILTYPVIWQWSTHYYTDGGDGLQNVWNIWWVHKAIVELHQLPWHTNYLHAPHGSTLIGHTLNPINGLVGIPLGWIFSAVHVHNIIVVGTFALSGLFAFWLAKDVTGKYWPAIAAGYAYTFTGHHFAHAQGHMQLISMEFIPLFMLLWLRLLRKPSYKWAIAASLAITAVLLCDLYYLFYCVMAGAIAFVCYGPAMLKLARRGEMKPHQLLLPLATFVALSGALCGPFIYTLMWTSSHDPFWGAHPAELFSADPWAIVTPGGHSWLGRFDQSYWEGIPGNQHEQSVEIGLAILLLAACGVTWRKRTAAPVWFWTVTAIVFYLFSLGPTLTISPGAILGGGSNQTAFATGADAMPTAGSTLFHGARYFEHHMPYAWLEAAIPPVKLSGCPVRMTVMVALALSVLCACGLSAVMKAPRGVAIGVSVVFALGMIVELWPTPQATYAVADVPHWVYVLRDLPEKGAAVTQTKEGDGQVLYFQTIHNRPIAFGYISRVPASVNEADGKLIQAFRARDWRRVREELGFAYVVLSREQQIPGLKVVYSDESVVIQQVVEEPQDTGFHL